MIFTHLKLQAQLPRLRGACPAPSEVPLEGCGPSGRGGLRACAARRAAVRRGGSIPEGSAGPMPATGLASRGYQTASSGEPCAGQATGRLCPVIKLSSWTAEMVGITSA